MKKTGKLFMTKKSGRIIRDTYDALNDWYHNHNISLTDITEKYKLKSELSQVVQLMNIGEKSGKGIICILDSPPNFEMAQNLYEETKMFINNKRKSSRTISSEPSEPLKQSEPSKKDELVEVIINSILKSIDLQNNNGLTDIISSMIINSIRENVINTINPLIGEIKSKAKEEARMYLIEKLDSVFK